LARAFPHVYRMKRGHSSKPLFLATRTPSNSKYLHTVNATTSGHVRT
jgi:hypothetical protein